MHKKTISHLCIITKSGNCDLYINRYNILRGIRIWQRNPPCHRNTGDFCFLICTDALSAGRKAPALPAGALYCISYDLLTCRYLLSLLSRFRRKRSQPQKLVPIAIEMICLTVRTFSIVRLGISFTLSRHPSIQTRKKQGTKIKNFFIGVIFAFSIVIYSFTNLKIFCGLFRPPCCRIFRFMGEGVPLSVILL